VGTSLSWGYSFGIAWGISFGRGVVGGGGSKGRIAKSKGWARERAIFEASREIRPKVVNATLIKNAVIQTEVSYSAELEKLNNLKQEFAKLQMAYNSKQEQAKDMQDSAIVLSDFISDEEDAISVLITTQEFEARQCLMASIQPILGEFER
jgi:hypothetical protein